MLTDYVNVCSSYRSMQCVYIYPICEYVAIVWINIFIYTYVYMHLCSYMCCSICNCTCVHVITHTVNEYGEVHKVSTVSACENS